MKTEYDVIIIGAGPAGCYTAGLLRNKLDVAVLEEHETAGKKPCTGLISTNLDSFMEVEDGFVENRVKGAFIHLPSGRELKAEKPGTAAYVIDRNKFDAHLARRAEPNIMFGTRAEGIDIREDRVEIKTSRGLLKSKMVMGADGVNSVVRNHFSQRPKEIVNGLTAFTDEADASDHVHIYLDKKLISDGFLWKVPRGRRTEYGALGAGIDFRLLERFFRLRSYEKKAHPIPIGPNKTYFGRAILIGDAAGITKPWSGGGVIYGLFCSRIAADVILKAFKENDFSESFLKEYETQWKKLLWKNIKRGLLLRRLLKSSSNTALEALFRVLERKDMSRKDMDLPF